MTFQICNDCGRDFGADETQCPFVAHLQVTGWLRVTGALERPPYVVLTQMHDGDVLVHGEGPLMTDAERWAKYGLAQMVGPDSDPTPHVIAPSHRQFLVRLRAALGKWHPHLDYELRLL